MFGIFKKVTYSEQSILTTVAMDLLSQINNLPHDFISMLPQDKYQAILKYQNAAHDALKYGNDLDGRDAMPRLLYNKAMKELSAACKILEETEKIINNK